VEIIFVVIQWICLGTLSFFLFFFVANSFQEETQAQGYL
jgi:hypothetical protein